MNITSSSLGLTRFESACSIAAHEMPYPAQCEIEHLGLAVTNEVLDVFLNTALEDHLPIIMEGLIGGLHSAILRIQRETDRHHDEMRRLIRDFDGSEIKDVELQETTQSFNRGEAAVMIMEIMRDAANENYTAQTGSVWTPWRGSAKNHATTYAQIEVKEALRAKDRREQGLADPGTEVVVFRGAPKANRVNDANRIYDALNWALSQFPNMQLATTGNHGAEQLALKWARDKKINTILSKANFEKFKAAAPFKANDDLLALDPILVLTLDHTLEPTHEDECRSFGPAANIAQKAREKGIRTMAVKSKK
jgi:hypothetical protein